MKNENESVSENENESHDESVQQIQHPFHWQHPLVLVAKQGNEGLKAHCDGCGELLSAPCFSCIHCNYHLHKQCAEAPLDIPNHPLHPKCLDARLFLGQRPSSPSSIYGCALCKEKQLTKQDCKICFKEVRLERGSYSCGKLGCNYVVHVNCVLQYDKLYEVIEDEKQCEELEEKSMQSSIIRVIEVNESGEATKIEHLSHQHCLVLADKMEEEIDRKCDGCMLPISKIFYYCSECPFFLHKTCAELPRIKQHWFRQRNATLNFDSSNIQCDFCRRNSSGFFYYIGESWVCIRCAKVADIIECEGHHHFLFFDFQCMEKCNGCGKWCWTSAFRCGKCRFSLDFGCLTLPHSVLHKIDEHKLKLTYHDDKEQSYCDICEQYKDPSLWYYSCSICDTSAHPECVLGQFPFLKDGSIMPSYFYRNHHHHDLKFFRKVEGFPECSRCGKFCQEEILKCEKSTCNYIVHCKDKCRRGH
ncbi:hypothetical protein Gotur_017717 [Gossypium turneri]